jgi:uncharacterized protein
LISTANKVRAHLMQAGRQWLAGLLWMLLNLGLASASTLPVPALSGSVIDQTQTLSAPQIQQIQAQLKQVEDTLGSQIVVLMVRTTEPEDIAAYAFRVADAWKIGRKDIGDGVLLVVAKNDRRVRIEVAKDLEGAIPDLAAKQIIDQALTPAFRAGDFAGGISQAITHLVARIKGENLPLPNPTPQRSNGLGDNLGQLAPFLFVGVPIVGGMLIGVFGRKIGSLVTGLAIGGVGWWLTASVFIGGVAGVLAMLFAGALGVGVGAGNRSRSSGGWGPGGGFSGGGGGGGGFSSGGGGSFGGGGASGNW